MPPIDWDKIFQYVMQIIDKCMANSTAQDRLQVIRNHRLRARAALGRAVRAVHPELNWFQHTGVVSDGMAQLDCCSDEELLGFCEQSLGAANNA